jgi:hypothetical protein
MQMFELGRTVATQSALETLLEASINPLDLLGRHVRFDQDAFDADDFALNLLAVKAGGRLFSAFVYTGIKFYVITEWDRSSVCILLPEEY